MAVTHGHGNPDWTRDETILALELFFQIGGKVSSVEANTIALSNVLRSLPYHENVAQKETFRNPSGVAFKVQNLRQLATGKGLGNVSKMDREIWQEFGDKPQEVTRLAMLIRAGIAASIIDPIIEPEVEFYEGKLLTRLHYSRERNPKVREALITSRSADGLRCDICAVDHANVPLELREAAFEAHHTTPLHAVGEGKTKLKDVALLCATCHRLIHRAIAKQRKWVSVTDAKQQFGY